ncbi:TonB-dependent receptor [Porphyromonas pogonae]|uniref:SusC/RagA family TonB-linked outer membrane protein n=1 Tax=Porphyromonas pogonae TaxID=867595 RepID=UPI002E76593C|nr:TonB-dependent receptor [Porphyromonas pogonae]
MNVNLQLTKYFRSYRLGTLIFASAIMGVCANPLHAARPISSDDAEQLIQQNTVVINGTVVDEKGEAIIGASVIEKSMPKNGFATDVNGKFSIKVPEGAVLIITSVGYKKVEVKAHQGMKVVLQDDAKALKEVVVVGYGTQKKVNLTGAVANVNVKEAVASRPVTDVAKALQGITPGLTITNNTGGVGTNSTIKLRGAIGSLNASGGTSPLILVDNVEIPDINLINPDDIETISVLKDAASSSIYGTRAAWGVILITTKSGKRGDKVQVTYSNNFAWNTPTKKPELASTVDNAKFALEVMKRIGLSSKTNIGYTIDDYALKKMMEWNEKYGNMSEKELGELQQGRDFEVSNGKTYFYRSFDPMKEFTKNWTPQQTHNLSISGGNDKTIYNISLGYLNQKGIMKFNTDQYNRYNVNSSITTNIKDWWRVKANILYTKSENEQPYRFTSGQYDAWFYLLRWPRWYPYTTYEGKEFRSAVTDIKAGNKERETQNYIRLNLGTELNPLQNLTVNFDYTYSSINVAEKRDGGKITAYDMFSAAPFDNYKDIYGSSHDRAVQSSSYTTANIFKAYGTYLWELNDNHNFKFMAGMDAEKREALSHYSERRGLISMKYPEIALATGDQYSYSPYDSYHNELSSAGFFGRINYNFQEKYLLELNARYDGSSKFPQGKKWALFPSVSAGWRLSEEKFMEWSKPYVSNMKIRASWGTIGNQDVPANTYISTMSSGNANWIVDGKEVTYLNSPSIISPELTWERVTTLDIGADMRFFNNKFGITMDWYQRVTSDMHSPGETLPLTFGAKSPLINFGEITGKGFEIAMDFNHRFGFGLGVNARASLSHVSEKITKYNSAIKNINSYYEGKKLGEIWGYETDRLFQASDFNPDGTLKDGIASQSLFESGNSTGFKFGPGDVKYKDLDGDGKITYGKNTVDDHGDQKVIGNSLPNYEYSFSFGLDYKGFDFSMFFQGVGKHDYWAYGAFAIPSGGSSYADAFYAHQTDYWTPTNTGAFYPRPSDMSWKTDNQNYLKQTRFLSNMAYLRCKNITVGYTLPEIWVQKIFLQSARVYFSGENLFEFDHMKIPVDPESTAYKAGAGSSTWAFGRSYPFNRTLSMGVKIGF